MARSVERGYFFCIKNSGESRVAPLAFSRALMSMRCSVVGEVLLSREKHVGESPANPLPTTILAANDSKKAYCSESVLLWKEAADTLPGARNPKDDSRDLSPLMVMRGIVDGGYFIIGNPPSSTVYPRASAPNFRKAQARLREFENSKKEVTRRVFTFLGNAPLYRAN